MCATNSSLTRQRIYAVKILTSVFQQQKTLNFRPNLNLNSEISVLFSRWKPRKHGGGRHGVQLEAALLPPQGVRGVAAGGCVPHRGGGGRARGRAAHRALHGGTEGKCAPSNAFHVNIVPLVCTSYQVRL